MILIQSVESNLLSKMKARHAIRCQRCTTHHRTCDKGHPCSRCEQAGLSCVYRAPRTKKACDYCSAQHRRCDKTRRGCLLNLVSNPKGLDAPGSLSVTDPASPAQSSSPYSPNHLQTQVGNGSSLPRFSPPPSDMSPKMESADPLLQKFMPVGVPALSDWSCVYAFFHNTDLEVQSSLPHFIIDRQRFLDAFLSQPAALWLIIIASAQHHNSSTDLAQYNYGRAKAAVREDIGNATLKTVQALFLISQFAFLSGDREASDSFLRLTVDSMLALNANSDASESDSSLTDERRRTYLRVFHAVKSSESINPEMKRSRLPDYACQLPSVGIDFQAVLSYFHTASLLELISVAKMHHYSATPITAQNILSSPSMDNLYTRLASMQSNLPDFLLFHPLPLEFHTQETLNQSTWNRQLHFVSHLMQRCPSEQSASIELTCVSNAAICVSLRSKLYLTGFLNESSPILQDLQNRLCMLSTIAGCLSAATCIADMATFLLAATRFDPFSVPTGTFSINPALWKMLPNIKYALFEAAVTLWYLACRTRAVFFPVTHDTAVFRAKVVASLHDILHVLSMMARISGQRAISNVETVVGPLERCVQAMLREAEGSTSFLLSEAVPLEDAPECLGTSVDHILGDNAIVFFNIFSFIFIDGFTSLKIPPFGR
ncbi:hypothetical protein BC830DRAFT_1101045 [Chytriomyces sp. MP71]|nr:hypothetical protein BC830DRAFT_1101045 [Chytriomyces sp. MP71]